MMLITRKRKRQCVLAVDVATCTLTMEYGVTSSQGTAVRNSQDTRVRIYGLKQEGGEFIMKGIRKL